MTTAQPGQEQRMVELTLEMIQAGAKAFNRLHGDCCYPVAMDAEAEAAAIKIYGDMVRADTRPTVDLREDGELVPVAWRWRYVRERGPDTWTVRQSPAVAYEAGAGFCAREVEPLYGPEAADRLILYREALVKARPLVEAYFECLERTEALAAIDAVLSRSGG